MFIWSYYRLPETWNRSYHELDILFAKRVPAREFANTVVDPFNEHEANVLAERYTVSDETRRPSFVPSISKRVDKAEQAQRRASMGIEHGDVRQSSIAGGVSEYLKKQNLGA